MVRKTWEIAVRFTEPAHPEDEHAERSHRQVVAGDSPTLAVGRILADTGAERNRTDQRQHATHAVDDRRTGKIVETKVCEPAAAPGPVAFNRIDQQRDDRTVDQIHRELRPLGHCTAHNRSRGGAEDRLKDQEALHGQVTLVERQVAPVGQADETGAVAAEHEAEADEPEKQGAEHEVHKVLHQDVRRVLAAGETRFAQRKARLHKENQHRGQQHPDRIEGNGNIVHFTYVLKGSTFCPGAPCRRALPCGWTRCR